jgi:hypothetical protein
MGTRKLTLYPNRPWPMESTSFIHTSTMPLLVLEQNHVEAVVGEVLDDAIVAIDATVVADALVAVSDSNLQPQAVVISGQEGRPLGIDARRKPAGASSTSLPSDVREGVLI